MEFTFSIVVIVIMSLITLLSLLFETESNLEDSKEIYKKWMKIGSTVITFSWVADIFLSMLIFK